MLWDTAQDTAGESATSAAQTLKVTDPPSDLIDIRCAGSGRPSLRRLIREQRGWRHVRSGILSLLGDVAG